MSPTEQTAQAPPPRKCEGKLIALSGDSAGARWIIRDWAVIGRGLEADVVLNDLQVSRQHSRIVREGGGYFIEDLNSRNGTSVNGAGITRAELSFGDKIKLSPGTMLLFTRHDPAEERIRHRQRLEALGRLAVGIAHDLNNMLGVILSTTDFISRLGPFDEQVRDSLSDVQTAALRASQLTPRLVDFTRSSAAGFSRVNISEVCEEVAQLVRAGFDQSIRIDASIARGLFVHGDSVELHQALMNLCLNAREAMPEGGRLTIKVRKLSGSEARTAGLPSASPQVHISVRDTGVGMSEETLAKAFEPFFTTKHAGSGSGLGLAMVKEIIEQHNGAVRPQSRLGEGTVISVFLPVMPRKRDQLHPVNVAELMRRNQPGANKIVLVVDSEPAILRSFARILRHEGYEVLTAADGAAAVLLFAGSEPKPDLVILDLNLPELQGEITLRRLREIVPKVRVLISTGLTPSAQKKISNVDTSAILTKPCSASTLLEQVEHTLVVHPDTWAPETVQEIDRSRL